MVIHKRILIPTMLVLVGLVIIFAVPTTYEGPLFLYINEQHAIRLMDAIGLVLVVPSWLYLTYICSVGGARSENVNEYKDGRTAYNSR